jgi:ectoine hydroxylase-related dioxygenase (phytanoyl-CoA dioxygenase family)
MEVGGARYEITVAMTGPFADPALFANPLLTHFVSRPLGEDFRLSSFTAVVSHPGADIQHIHRDHAYLFGDASIDAPVYAINCSLPLIDIDAATGPTGIWPGSHKWPESVVPPPSTSFSCEFLRGDVVLMDYRTLHTGLPNRGTRARPILYMVYARPWFFDDVNHMNRIPLDMPLEVFAQMPHENRQLLSRAYTAQVRARWLSGQHR